MAELVNSFIGLDFGNFFSQTGIFVNIDKDTRRGGTYHDLTDPAAINQYGIPSAFFYGKRYGNNPIIGQNATTAIPAQNCIRYLKRDMKKGKVTIDGRDFTYDEMITAVIQHVMRVTQTQMENKQLPVTNKVCLAYPVSFSHADRQHLIDLAQQATLKDGTTHIEIVGTIAEPAAAALDYLATVKITKPTEVMVYDLGGGTFDISIVKVYPTPQKRADGSIYYYDILHNDGLAKLGGLEFDNVITEINLKNAGQFKNDMQTVALIQKNSELNKRQLSDDEIVQPDIMLPDGQYIAPITRTEFEKNSKNLLDETIEMVRQAFNSEQKFNPELIILTGGGSRMPMVEKALETAFPKYKGKIKSHNPSKAISMGAARFAINEPNDDIRINTIVSRTTHDIGICYFDSIEDKKGHIKTYISAGTEIPAVSEDIPGHSLSENDHILYRIHEAKKLNPNAKEPAQDYIEICKLNYDNGCIRPAGHSYTSRITIDDKNLLTLTVRETDVPEHKAQTAHCDVSSNIE